jgi:hypothetical protein
MALVILEPPARLLLAAVLVLGTPRPIDRGRASEPGRRRLPIVAERPWAGPHRLAAVDLLGEHPPR